MRLLKKGDTIGLAATARYIEPSELSLFIKWLESKDLKVKFADNLFEKFHQFAGNDEFRASSFQKFLEDESIQAIWIVRGGYGSTRILNYLDWSKFIQNPKWIIGFSDITLIHLKIASLGYVSIHGDMPSRFEKVDIGNFESVLNILFNGELSYTFDYEPSNNFELTGKIIGGNLSLFVHALGNSNIHLGKDYLLFLEDLEEYLYHIDRMAYQLKYNGIFENTKALLLGSFTDLKDNEVPFGFDVHEIFKNLVNQPIINSLPFGHDKDNLAFIHGYEMELKVKNNQVKIHQKLKL